MEIIFVPLPIQKIGNKRYIDIYKNKKNDIFIFITSVNSSVYEKVTCLETTCKKKKKKKKFYQFTYIPFKFNIILTHPQCTDDAMHTVASRLVLNDGHQFLGQTTIGMMAATLCVY